METLTNATEEAVREVIPTDSIIGILIPAIRYCVAIIAIVVNASIILAFLVQKVRRPSIQISPAGLLVLNLLLIDTVLSVTILQNLATSWTFMAAGSSWCASRMSISFFGAIGSHIALLSVVVDRFIAIVYGLKYRTWMTWGRSVAVVCCGWLIPVVGAVSIAVAVIATQDLEDQLERCSDIYASKVFLRFVWIPLHFTANLGVIVIQCRVYFYLQRHDKEKATCNQVHKCSDKFAWILFRITTPTYLAMLLLDLTKITLMLQRNQVTLNMYQLVLVFVQIAFLMNPLMYAYATGNIRRPIVDLCGDIKMWLRLSKKSGALSPPDSVTTEVSSVKKSLPSQSVPPVCSVPISCQK